MTSTPKATPDDFVLAKSLELCTAVFGLDLVAQVFSIDRCQTLLNGADIKGNYRIAAIAAHIAMAVTASNVKMDKLNNHSDQYVEGVINWLCQILSAEPMDKTTDGRFDLQQHCAAICVELILEYTAEEGLSTRRQALSGVISWLDTRRKHGDIVMEAAETDVPAGLSAEGNADMTEEQPALASVNDGVSGEVGEVSSEDAASDEDIVNESNGVSATEHDARMAEEQLALASENDDVSSEVSGEDAAPDEDIVNAQIVESAVLVTDDVEAVPESIYEPATVMAVDDNAEPDAVPGDAETLPPSGDDTVVEPHQALDVAALEDSIPVEVAQENTRSPLQRAKSKTSGSFRQPVTREERLKAMVKVAEAKARKDRLGEGVKGVFQATMDDIGALGIGMQLYFMLTKYLSIVFLCMGILALPAIMENTYGHGITSKTVDPLQLAYSSIGNGGVNSDTAADPRNCLPIGDIDCTWETVDTPMTSNPKTVTWIITLTDCLYSFLFLCFLLYYSYRAKRAIKAHQIKHFTPARYAVLVRGLPKDATEKEIMEHFNNLYDPTKEEEYSKLWFGFYWGKRQKVRRSPAQSTQKQFASKMPPDGLCDRALPAVFYADTSFSVNATSRKTIPWSLVWDKSAALGDAYPDPVRCVDPCISEASNEQCNTLPCFYYDELVKADSMTCQAYEASHVLYCFCSTALTSSIQKYGFVNGPKSLWNNIPCRGFTKDYLIKNSFILLAAGIVVIVNFLLNSILHIFAVFERHTSESARTITVSIRMFGAQFLNTALIVIIVNAYLGLSDVPLAGELLNGKYQDFVRAWYPTVGMGIATTMLLNAFLPQFTLFGKMYVISPFQRCVKTTYDEMLGEVTLEVLPWTLALHLGLSAWMYGNTNLLKGTMMNLPWLLKSVGLSSVVKEHPNATTEELYTILTSKISDYDVLGQYGFLVKLVYSHVMLMTVLCFTVVVGLLLYLVFGRLVFVVLKQMLVLTKQVLLLPVDLILSLRSKEYRESHHKAAESLKQKEKRAVVMLPEFSEPFQMSVKLNYRPDVAFGFKQTTVDNTSKLVCMWQEDMEYANGILRAAGERKLTWETMQAPVKSYAIEANEKYRLAVGQISAAWNLVAKARVPEPVKLCQVTPMLEHDGNENEIEIAVTATEPITAMESEEVKVDETAGPDDVEISEVSEIAATVIEPATATETGAADKKGSTSDDEATGSNDTDQPGVIAAGSNDAAEEAENDDSEDSSAAVESEPGDVVAATEIEEAGVALEDEAIVDEGMA
ncbi:hypothetical protein BBJ29_008398 [Phytophthora kernoviae]|uniref:CSC1/OSCA1-like cytosolic domain-containing protein n=1 Tax=Phytophthora kernoviae TaxID=325452 RepID=A0A3F2RHS5_9STRA|nr:hypothetical protein BBJ29_008398 [Phytophthora kernoviae]RLN57318.1 hypothetical protein BBP00_00007558 [Phytophthora kernoviae]